MAGTNDQLVSEFMDVTGAPASKAVEYLTAAEWDVASALATFFDDEQNPTAGDSAAASSSAAIPGPEYTGPRTLDGRPAPEYAGSSSASKRSNKPQKRTGVATLGSLGSSHQHDHDDDEDDDDEDEDDPRGPRDLFAGGEKSGLAVQDPSQRGMNNKKLVKDIVAMARANAKGDPEGGQNPNQSSSSRPSFFGGTGQTLGGDGVESRTIPNPNAASSSSRAPQQDAPLQERTLHLWQDGFSIDDGELRRFDDPANHTDLQMIRQGRAPLHLMNVRLDQRVDVKLEQHTENWHPQPKVYRPFGGEGRRLGSPVPGEGVASPSSLTTTTAAAAPPASSAAPSTNVDESRPTLMLRIQLPNGTRLPARFNLTQTIGDVYEFVARSWTPLDDGRPWVLATTFPRKDHTDRSLVLGEVPEFKKGGTAVVKWS